MAKTIMWIEDDTPIIDPVVRPLRRAGYTIRVLPTVAEALAAVDEIRAADLILLDMILPPGDIDVDVGFYPGMYILRQLQEKYQVTTPVLVLTVVTRNTVHQELHRMGVKNVLNKPILPLELKREVEKALAPEA